MYICRLFHRDRPFEQVDARVLGEGRVTLGRDPSADWPIADPDGVLSRLHCTLTVEDGRVWLTDLSTNGTFLGDGSRAPTETALELQPRQTLKLGALTLLVDEMQDEPVAACATMVGRPAAPAPAAAERRLSDASLLGAFCEGAKLDASALSAEDPAELMRRAGAVYRETVMGLSALMAERARFKSDQGLDRTTIRAAENNPFKWAPTRAVAQDLLTGAASNFLSDGQAVGASFRDLQQHLAALTEGAKAAVGSAVESLAPDAIDAEARKEAGLLKSRASACWEIHNRRHARLTADRSWREEAVQAAVGRAYRQAAPGALP